MRVNCTHCEQCGSEIQNSANKRFCSRQCSGLWHSGVNHPTFKGRIPHNKGYVRVWAPGHPLANGDGYVLEHRMIAFDAGIISDSSGHVHHKNGNKQDNRIENLENLSASDHMLEHRQPGAQVVNQYGVWAVLTPEQRKEKQRETNARRYRR